MELSTRPLSVAEPAFHSIAANYLSGSLQTDLSLSASCRTATEASYTLYTQVYMHRRWQAAGYMYFWSKYLLKYQIERSNSILCSVNVLHFHLNSHSASPAEGRDMWSGRFKEEEKQGFQLQLKKSQSITAT